MIEHEILEMLYDREIRRMESVTVHEEMVRTAEDEDKDNLEAALNGRREDLKRTRRKIEGHPNHSDQYQLQFLKESRDDLKIELSAKVQNCSSCRYDSISFYNYISDFSDIFISSGLGPQEFPDDPAALSEYVQKNLSDEALRRTQAYLDAWEELKGLPAKEKFLVELLAEVRDINEVGDHMFFCLKGRDGDYAGGGLLCPEYTRCPQGGSEIRGESYVVALEAKIKNLQEGFGNTDQSSSRI